MLRYVSGGIKYPLIGIHSWLIELPPETYMLSQRGNKALGRERKS